MRITRATIAVEIVILLSILVLVEWDDEASATCDPFQGGGYRVAVKSCFASASSSA
jgi:hypothetical protein